MDILMPGVFARGMCDLGVAEFGGSARNPRIMAYYALAGVTPPDDATYEWCGFALGAWVKEEGFDPPAQWWFPDSWATWGTAEANVPPRAGAVAVKKGSNTHVALVAGVSPPGARPWLGSGWGVCTLGGNQGGVVSIGQWGPISDYKAFRRGPA